VKFKGDETQHIELLGGFGCKYYKILLERNKPDS